MGFSRIRARALRPPYPLFLFCFDGKTLHIFLTVLESIISARESTGCIFMFLLNSGPKARELPASERAAILELNLRRPPTCRFRSNTQRRPGKGQLLPLGAYRLF